MGERASRQRPQSPDSGIVTGKYPENAAEAARLAKAQALAQKAASANIKWRISSKMSEAKACTPRRKPKKEEASAVKAERPAPKSKARAARAKGSGKAGAAGKDGARGGQVQRA